MAAPIADKIILPLDTGNTGKKKRTQTRVVGADTVHEDFVIPISDRKVTGSYKASSGTLTVPTAVHNGTTTGFLWLCNPVGSTIKMAAKRIMLILSSMRLYMGTLLVMDLLHGSKAAVRSRKASLLGFRFSDPGSHQPQPGSAPGPRNSPRR